MLLILLFALTNTVYTRKARPDFDPEKKLFVITLDGFRWKELFYGADSSLIHSLSAEVSEEIQNRFWHSSSRERRNKLFPFLWSVIGKTGQVYGNRDQGSKVDVANPYGLSYPGYSELLTGKVDFRIFNNSGKNNTNQNILELLNNDTAFKNKVAAFASWNYFSYILNNKNGKVYLDCGKTEIHGSAGYGLALLKSSSPNLNELSKTRSDKITFNACTEYVRRKKPSIVFLGFSGTDDAGHAKKYDQYLDAANRADSMISSLWNWIQSTPGYAGQTSLLITTDHGRGDDAGNWNEHGFFTPGSSHSWLAIISPWAVPAGEVTLKHQTYLHSVSELVFELLKK